MRLIEDLKSLDQIECGIEKLLSIKSSEDDAYERMFNIIKNDLHPIPFPVVDLVPDYDYSKVFRARINLNINPFEKITDIASHSNLDYVIKFGRCNTPGQSTFYCAENRETSEMELLNGDILDNSTYIMFTNGRWKIKKRMSMGLLIHAQDVIKVNPFIKEKYDEFQIFLDNEFPKQRIVINRLLDFFSEYFSRPFNETTNNEYKLSSAFYNYVLLYCDGLIYPSVKIVFQGLNYAFSHNKYIQGYVELDRAMITIMKKTSEKSFQDVYSTEERSIMHEVNFIRWNKPSLPENQGYKLF